MQFANRMGVFKQDRQTGQLKAQRAGHRSGSGFELLEGRRLLSAVVIDPGEPSGTASVSEVTLHEHRDIKFTADLGKFITIAPATNLKATIDWGDGTTSKGMLKADGIVGIDQIKFEVDGTHTYQRAGAYSVQVRVVKPGSTPSPVELLVASFSDKAIVSRGNTDLTGKITGKLLPAPTAADIGAIYVLNGKGHAEDMSDVTAHGQVHLPGFIVSGHATGTLTLTSLSKNAADRGSVTLKLTGPTEPGFGPFPKTLSYVITSGTGAFTGATGVGTIAVILGQNEAFTFTITSLFPPMT